MEGEGEGGREWGCVMGDGCPWWVLLAGHCHEVFTLPGLFRMESMWNPWNPSGIPYGIHGMNVG